MMNSSMYPAGLMGGIMLHAVFCLLILIGIVFLIVWSVKTLPMIRLRNWGIGFLAVGVLGVALSGIFFFSGIHRTITKYRLDEKGGMQQMFKMMDEDEIGENDVKMGMDIKMMNSLEEKTGDEFDMAFLKMMIAHHEDAVVMAKTALEKAKHSEIKNLAQDILTAQQKEIDQMKEWAVTWGYTK